MKSSSFAQEKRKSPLGQLQNLKPGIKGSKSSGRRNMEVALPLTSLIDAFSIIVIYLLIGTQTSGIESNVPVQMNLPMAEHAVALDKEVTTLTIMKGVYRLNEKVVSVDSLTAKLSEIKKLSTEKSLELLVQADQEMKYQDLDPLLKASSASGFEKMKFAVVPAQ